jgi:GNAT superfamily N-acetyltransferase
MHIRAALPADADAIDRLFREFVAYLRTVGDHNEYRFGAQQYLEDGFGRDPAFRGLVAEDQARVIGYLLFSKGYDGDYVRYLYVVDLFVQDRSRNMGAGKMLMDSVREIARSEGIGRLSWSVHKNNSGAIRFYERLGAKYSDDTHQMYIDL